MASKACNRPRPWSFDVNPSPETLFHFPSSPSEPGKFDFYRVYLANHAYFTDQASSDNLNEPTLPLSTSSSSIEKRRWSPFAGFMPSDESKSSTMTTSQSSNSISTTKSEAISSMNSSVSTNTNSAQIELTHSAQSFPSLADLVKNAMNKGHLGAKLNQTRRSFTGTTLSSKDLNHLSPQSM
ncbi:unnamed protein product [Rotaria sp. Silwood1]|nr:unnamed protein product [Rotaria sp. Silwood1]CAF3356972.1 unnamed protein product [Rotaria sp. Silwood1]CAF3381751.1 unnamed protein product [Rotaria sp. Silwood1]CAF3388634.1 unnamed protein product [Rotaria sp. Silwood1]CAF4580747.1 unnamed protein product [Rotaria sp. Silwood1]